MGADEKKTGESLAASILLSEDATGIEGAGPYTYWAAQPDAIPSSEFVSASSGDRASSRYIIKQFVEEYRACGRVSGEAFEYVASIMEKVLDADTRNIAKRRGDDLVCALNLKNRLPRNQRHDSVVFFVNSISPDPKQRNDVLYRDLVEWGLLPREMDRREFAKHINDTLKKRNPLE